MYAHRPRGKGQKVKAAFKGYKARNRTFNGIKRAR